MFFTVTIYVHTYSMSCMSCTHHTAWHSHAVNNRVMLWACIYAVLLSSNYFQFPVSTVAVDHVKCLINNSFQHPNPNINNPPNINYLHIRFSPPFTPVCFACSTGATVWSDVTSPLLIRVCCSLVMRLQWMDRWYVCLCRWQRLWLGSWSALCWASQGWLAVTGPAAGLSCHSPSTTSWTWALDSGSSLAMQPNWHRGTRRHPTCWMPYSVSWTRSCHWGRWRPTGASSRWRLAFQFIGNTW